LTGGLRGVAARRRDQRTSAGQVLVLFALAVATLLAAAGLAFDVGRFYTERRLLQNAADAAALAAVNAMARGASPADAEIDARAVLTHNFASHPNGPPASQPSATPIYESGHAGDPDYLVEGILMSSGEARVALRNRVDYTFGRVVGLTSSEIGARARASWRGRLLPIAVPHFLNGPGPNAGAAAPCPSSINQFIDVFSTQLTSCLGSVADAVLRILPQPGAPWDPLTPDNDPSSHGPIVAILGQGAQPPNNADFRGFVALDIRNFASVGSQIYYNGVDPNMNENTLKASQARYIELKGYPGPDFPPAVTPPDPNNQVAAMSGNSTGAAIDAMAAHYSLGEEILVNVYDGNVMSIPDFAITPPSFIDLPATGLTANVGVLKVSRNQAFSGTVTLSTLADTLDPESPMVLGTMLGSDPVQYTPNPVTPSLGNGTSVAMNQVTTQGATPGIFNVWIQGQAGSPYLTTKFVPVPITIGTVTRDFTITSGSQSERASAAGDTVAFSLSIKNAPNGNTAFGGPVTLSVDPAQPNGIGGPERTGIGPVTFSMPTVTPTRAGATSTLTINTGTMAPGVYQLVVRATGMNADATPVKVTHLLPLTVFVGTAGSGRQDYVDVVGYAVMRIAEMNSNTVSAYAITPVIPDMNDPRLMRGQQARLIPWD
jgi:Putative Flp pilus-assembly TadE/G-like